MLELYISQGLSSITIILKNINHEISDLHCIESWLKCDLSTNGNAKVKILYHLSCTVRMG